MLFGNIFIFIQKFPQKKIQKVSKKVQNFRCSQINTNKNYLKKLSKITQKIRKIPKKCKKISKKYKFAWNLPEWGQNLYFSSEYRKSNRVGINTLIIPLIPDKLLTKKSKIRLKTFNYSFAIVILLIMGSDRWRVDKKIRASRMRLFLFWNRPPIFDLLKFHQKIWNHLKSM